MATSGSVAEVAVVAGIGVGDEVVRNGGAARVAGGAEVPAIPFFPR